MNFPTRRRRSFQASLLATISASMMASPALAQNQTQTPASSGVKSRSPMMMRSSRDIQMTQRARTHYQLLWGVDALDVKAVESGQMIRFSYLVLDPQRAATLNDKNANPYLIDEQAGVRLEIPTMEKVGQLRQSSTPEAGKSYWMVFSNKGSVVKPGDRVSIVIGHFKADGLYVR